MQWEPVIGLEVHVQLNTLSKIFSGASNANNDDPNAAACVIDLGLPGVLPVMNEAAITKAVTFGLAIGAQINKTSVFDRKNYFYPDLPKGYQISQFADPIVGKGELHVLAEDGSTHAIGITRAHLEEDAGKSVHDMFANASGIDLNRTGTPLLEIVSEPEITSAKEAAAYFRQLQTLVRYLKICDANLADGNMRCDANVSIRPVGATDLGQRTEIKNINSFKFVERAIEVEIERQIDVLEGGGSIAQATMLFDPDRDETRIMRLKEDSDDYRYFPDPDLLPVEISDEFIAQVRDALPELPDARAQRLQSEQGLSAVDANWLSRDPDFAQYYDAVFATSGDAKLSANWVMGELSAALNKHDADITQAPISSAQLGQLINRIKDGTLSGKLAKGLFDSLWQASEPGPAATVDAAIEEQGLQQVDDTDELTVIINELIQANPKQVEQFRAGKDKVLGFFVGQIMKATQGKANPKTVNELLRAALAAK